MSIVNTLFTDHLVHAIFSQHQ